MITHPADIATPFKVRHLGRQAYEPVWRAMSDFTSQRGPHTADELWLLEHDPVFTLGQAGRREHLLAPGDIPVVACDRGGQVTYHGPGQIVAYPLFDLRRLGLGVRQYVHLVEQCMIDALAATGIVAERRDGAPGVYVDGAKIGALGVRVRRGCTFHGLALNVNMDVEPFQRINPCGFTDLSVTQVVDSNARVDLPAVQALLVEAVAGCFNMEALAAGAPDLHKARAEAQATHPA
ncbi:MAG: lipoyl(octanoyl) transferase LipB [Rhodanobacteraceae bacterium]